jgi:uncharacterized membrane protein YkvI
MLPIIQHERRRHPLYRVPGIIIAVLAIIIAVVPMFTDCQSGGNFLTLANGNTTSMKCHWTGLAELAVALPLLATGVMMGVSKRRENLRFLGIAGLVSSVMVLALPTTLIGVCQSPIMTCVTLMKPSLIGLGSIALLLSLTIVFLPHRLVKD